MHQWSLYSFNHWPGHSLGQLVRVLSRRYGLVLSFYNLCLKDNNKVISHKKNETQNEVIYPWHVMQCICPWLIFWHVHFEFFIVEKRFTCNSHNIVTFEEEPGQHRQILHCRVTWWDTSNEGHFSWLKGAPWIEVPLYYDWHKCKI